KAPVTSKQSTATAGTPRSPSSARNESRHSSTISRCQHDCTKAIRPSLPSTLLSITPSSRIGGHRSSFVAHRATNDERGTRLLLPVLLAGVELPDRDAEHQHPE